MPLLSAISLSKALATDFSFANGAVRFLRQIPPSDQAKCTTDMSRRSKSGAVHPSQIRCMLDTNQNRFAVRGDRRKRGARSIMALLEVGLDDKYRLDAKRIFLSGTQALVRLPMLQRERDRAAGLKTAGFISGYRGSPDGMYDHALWRAKSFLQQHDIAFVPGLNEDLAATAVWGSQQVGMFPGAKVDGVFGIWYGKGPGVDRSLDALKHTNSAG